jgi:hypothetical protein
MNKLIFKIIIFFIFVNIIYCTNTNIEKMINFLREQFTSLESNVNKQLNDFKNEKIEGLYIIIINYFYF